MAGGFSLRLPPHLRSSRSCPLLQPRKQLRQRDSKPLRYLYQIREAQIGFPPFYCAHKRPMHPAVIGKAFLRVPLLQAKLSNPLAQRFQNLIHFQESSKDGRDTSTVNA